MYALVDCNNFFVSCERVFQPELEGKAVVVLSNNDGCVVARSNESKAMGIKMGTPYFKVKHLVEAGTLITRSSNYALYGDLSSRVMSILASSVPKIEVYSIDEAFLNLTGITGQIELCRSLRAQVRKWVGIPVSIGISPTKTLCKIASHFAKTYPGYKGVCIIDNEDKRIKALNLTPVSDVWGVGRRLAPKLESCGIRTALDLSQRNPKWLREKFNIQLVRTWAELNGQLAIEEEKEEARQTICTSRSFAEMTSDLEVLSQRVSDYAAVCARKLREEGTVASEVTTFMYTNRFREDMPQYFPALTLRLEVATNSTHEIVSAALKALRLIYSPDYKYKKAGVTVSGIFPSNAIQASLFDSNAELRQKHKVLSEIIDKVNVSAGDGSLRLATQKKGHYADDIRSDFRSKLFTTSLSEIIEVH
jgi:DNA polymerase V